MAVLERMKTTMMAAKLNLESKLHQKNSIATKTAMDSMSMAQAELKEALLQVLHKTDCTNEHVTHSGTLCCANSLHQRTKDIAGLKKSSTKDTLPPKRETCPQASSASMTDLQLESGYTSVFEGLLENAFHLLVTYVFLNRTKKQVTVRQARNLLHQYPTPEALAKANCGDIKHFSTHLGLFKRAEWLVELAKTWCRDPPQAHKLHIKGTGKSALRSEVSHLKGVGQLAVDIGRIFCKDDLYIKAGFRVTAPEWKKVLPTNEGLKSYLQGCWNNEGFDWNRSRGALQKHGFEVLDQESYRDNENE